MGCRGTRWVGAGRDGAGRVGPMRDGMAPHGWRNVVGRGGPVRDGRAQDGLVRGEMARDGMARGAGWGAASELEPRPNRPAPPCPVPRHPISARARSLSLSLPNQLKNLPVVGPVEPVKNCAPSCPRALVSRAQFFEWPEGKHGRVRFVYAGRAAAVFVLGHGRIQQAATSRSTSEPTRRFPIVSMKLQYSYVKYRRILLLERHSSATFDE